MNFPGRPLLLLLTGVLWCSLNLTAAESRRPNVILIVTDDQGWGDLSISGNTNLATPRIDALARAGAILEHFYVAPVCSPTRAELLTGRYATRGGVFATSAGGERLNLDERTLADVFKTAGYATGVFGKWHNGEQYPYHPNGRGFDEFYGFCSGHWGDYFNAPLEHNGERVTGQGYLPDDLTDHALRFIETNRDKPFLCYLPLNTPHSPLQVPDQYYAKFATGELTLRAANPADEDQDFTRAVLAMCENIDWNVGRVLDQLDRLHLADDTIVIYFSDNGPNARRWNGGMKGIKGSVDEGGVRSPCFIRWPGRIQPGTKLPQLAGAIDLLPTLADSAGIPLGPTKPLDGISMKSFLLGQTTTESDRLLYAHWGGRTSVRSLQYRLDDAGQLYDLVNDPGQQTDISARKPEVATALNAARREWKKEVQADLSRDDRPLPVGYRQHPLTRLVAGDAVPTGGIRRSNKYPNCSFLENWTSPEDHITWDVEIVTAGNYQVTLRYACSQADTGSTIELEFLGHRLSGLIEPANEVPLRGAENDRVPRIESYIKDFAPLELGKIKLPAGRAALTLRALHLAGTQVMELESVELRLMP